MVEGRENVLSEECGYDHDAREMGVLSGNERREGAVTCVHFLTVLPEWKEGEKAIKC